MSTITPTITSPDAFTVQIVWGPVNAGDTCLPAQFWAYPSLSWQLTGFAQDGIIANPNVPVEPDRSVDVLGSNDGTCFGKIFTMVADPAGMASRQGDPVRDGSADQRFYYVKPVINGTPNPAGPDCSIILFALRPFGQRTD
jgi:hypothetical protein